MKKSCLFGLMNTFTFSNGRTIYLLSSLIGGVLLTQNALADKYSVCEAACDFTAIQDAVDFAQNGDTIDISNGTYLEDIIIIDKSLHLKGEDQIQTVINGTGPVSVITLECMNDYTSIVISDLSITGAAVYLGAGAPRPVGIHNDQCSLKIRNSLIHNNSGDIAGGGITTTGPTFIENSTVADNGTKFGPGGIGIFGSGTLELKNSVIARNGNGCSAKVQGCGISNYGTDLSVINSSIIDNRSPPGCNGTGIYNRGSLSIKDSTISGNINAGGILNAGGDANISSSVIENNKVFGISNSGNLTLRSSLVANNSGPNQSGIINIWEGAVDVLSSTISSNEGGGINNAGVMVIKSSTISDNVFTRFRQGGGIYNSGELVLKKSDIISNGVRIGDEQYAEGGGIYNTSTGAVTASKTTIENNRPDNCGGVGFTCP